MKPLHLVLQRVYLVAREKLKEVLLYSGLLSGFTVQDSEYQCYFHHLWKTRSSSRRAFGGLEGAMATAAEAEYIPDSDDEMTVGVTGEEMMDHMEEDEVVEEEEEEDEEDGKNLLTAEEWKAKASDHYKVR